MLRDRLPAAAPRGRVLAGLGRYFGSALETWLGMRMAYDLWQARARADEIKVNRFEAA